MALTIWTTAALTIWIILWSIGAKAFDAFLLALLIIIIGATVESVKKYMPNRR